MAEARGSRNRQGEEAEVGCSHGVVGAAAVMSNCSGLEVAVAMCKCNELVVVVRGEVVKRIRNVLALVAVVMVMVEEVMCKCTESEAAATVGEAMSKCTQ